MGNAAEKYSIDDLEDPRFFIETFFFIVDKENRARVPFLLRPAQEKYYQNRTFFDLILKARKEGFSSLIEAMWLHACLFTPNTRAVTISHELESTMRHFDRVHYYLDNMELDGMRFVVDTSQENQRQITIPKLNSSYWIGTAGSKAFGRGDDITHLHLSEVAHYEHQEFLTGVLEACVPKARRVMETTANGVGEKFWQLWTEADDPQNHSPWKQHFFGWYEDPANTAIVPQGKVLHPTEKEKSMDRDSVKLTGQKLKPEQIQWYRNKYAELVEKEDMPQEYPSNPREAFLSSGRHIMPLEKVELMAQRCTAPQWTGEIRDDGQHIDFIHNPEGQLFVWKMPRDGRHYLITADVAEGVKGGAWSVATVYDRSSWEVVAAFRAHLDPGEFGDVLVNMGIFWNWAVLCPELNNHGWATRERIKAKDYPHYFNTQEIWKEGELANKDGFPTTEKTRGMIFSTLRQCVDDLSIVVPFLTAVRELQTLVRDEHGKIVPEKGCFSDCAIALAIGAYLLKFMSLDDTYDDRAKLENHEIVGRMTTLATGRSKRRTGY